MSIAFFDVKEEWEKKLIKSEFKGQKVYIFEDEIQESNLEKLEGVHSISTFIYSGCSAEILSKFPNLKNISTRSTGYDHIDLEYCKEKGIALSNVPRYGEDTVAEFTMALLLSISRKIVFASQRVKSGVFDFTGLRGFDLKGKTIGIIGFGKIGQKFASLCKAFGMNVLVYDKFVKNYKNEVREIGVKSVKLNELYKTSDIVSVHLPLLKETKHMIKKSTFRKMKRGVVVLNTSRGELIKSKDLLDALNSGKVSFAGLDVLEGEVLIKDETELLSSIPNFNKANMKLILEDHILMNHNKVLLTPHNAFNTIDALQRILCTSILNLNRLDKEGYSKENRIV